LKTTLVGLLLLGSLSTFALEVSQSSYCQGRGQDQINNQVQLVQEGIATGEITNDLKTFFEKSIKDMQANHDYLCKGIRINRGETLTYKEKQLELIKKGIESGDIDEELATFFLNNLNEQ
jgi:hypothetical protein